MARPKKKESDKKKKMNSRWYEHDREFLQNFLGLEGLTDQEIVNKIIKYIKHTTQPH